MAKKEKDKYLVLKWEDIDRLYLYQQLNLQDIINEIASFNPNVLTNKYVVCNQDEPCANEVWEIILKGEDAKAKANS